MTERRPLKILHVLHSLEIGGLENGLVNLLNCLDPARFDQSVCCLTSAGKLVERISNPSVKIVELQIPETKFRFPIKYLARTFGELKPDIVHTRGWPTIDAVFAAYLGRMPHIIHGEHGREHSDAQGTNWKRNQIRRLVGHLIDRYVVVCDFFRPWLNETCRVSSDKIVYIPNGVDTKKFHPVESRAGDGSQSGLAAAKRDLRLALGLPGEGILIGSVGRLDPVKDFPTLLRSFKSVLPEFPQANLVVVGDGPIRSNLVDLSRELGLGSSVSWLGARSDIYALLRCFDVFVQTSIFEGMSNTILEAMASGLPIVATRTGGNPELVSDGMNGALIRVGDIEGLAETLRALLKDRALLLEYGSVSRSLAETQFDLSLMAKRYAEMYESLE